LRLFCFPYAGGGARIFRSWQDSLPQTVEVHAIELPGRDRRMREAPFTNLLKLVEELGPALQPYLDKPLAFFGHSMGAKISFELARYLRREYRLEPSHLFVSGSGAPQLPKEGVPDYTLPEPEFIEKVRSLNGTPPEVLDNQEIMRLLVGILRADFELVETHVYSPEPPLNCPITAVGGLRDDEVSRDQLDAWRIHTKTRFVLRMFPGDHFFLHTHQATLLRVLTDSLLSLINRLLKILLVLR
jgi:medium-chain acyl-[acyl-carrier-protein] hydrolase